MPASDSDIIDLAISTQKNLGPAEFRQIAQNLTEYEVAGYMLKRDKVTVSSGNGINRRLMLDFTETSRWTKLYEGDEVVIGDTLREINVPWRHMVTYYGWDRRELLMNRGESMLTNLMSVRRTSALLAQAELLENAYWSKPADSSDDRTMFGLFYWLVSSATTGFNGGNATGFSSGPGGLDASVDRNAKWRNYTAQFAAITKADLIQKMRRGHRLIGFKSPVPGGVNTAQTYRIYTGIENIEAIESLGESQNENLGKDIASMDGVMTFRGNPIVRIERLDSTYMSDRPLLFVNRDSQELEFLSGNVLRESEPDKVGGNHNLMAVFIDSTLNSLTMDRRRNAYFRYAA